MDTPPLVTIVTPSYNQAAYLGQTIRSVLSQDYPALEYFVVDGASTDGSLEIIRQNADRLAWWVSEHDSGQAEAINKGLQRASGRYVAWLNSDDLYLPGAFQAAVSALEQQPQLGMVFGDALSINASGEPTHWQAFGQWGLNELIRFRIIWQPAVFMRRSILENAGYLDRSYHYMLDHHLWLRMARLAPVGYIGGPGRSPLAAARYHINAKNVATPRGFSDEAERVMAWMQAQPDLAALIQRNPRQVAGGLYRLQGRYLLDGGEPANALRAYGKALAAWPRYALRHSHRMAYAMLSLAGLNRLVDPLRQQVPSSKLNRRLGASFGSELKNWPGICLEEAGE
jgi:hypothetical protein